MPEEIDNEKNPVTNYERMEKFDFSKYTGVVLDESGILKNYTGKYRTAIIAACQNIPYRLACTATPAPNDYMELGSHSEFIGAMSGSEMLASFFINDPANVGKYRLKGHAESKFWRWMASWAVMIRMPSDLGYDDNGFILPKLHMHEHILEANRPAEGMLFAIDANTMQERRAARKASMEDRVKKVCELVNSSDEEWLVWCDLNAESEMLAKGIERAVEVRGSMKDEMKEDRLRGFAERRYPVLVSKPSIAGWGMNYQHCRNMAFTGLSDSYEQFYQALRRCYRFGQEREVHCHIVTDRTEGAVVKNIKRKEADAVRMAEEMTKQMAYISRGELRSEGSFAQSYNTNEKMEVPKWLQTA